MDRAAALALMEEYTQSLSLAGICWRSRRRCGPMPASGARTKKSGASSACLHDFDYERWPDPPDHPLQGAAILKERGYPDDVIYAIKSHADYLPDCPRRAAR